MTPSKIYPVILCGGQGTRLWPLSRKAMPKQFARLTGKLSLLQTTVKRMENSGFQSPIAVTSEDYRFTVKDQFRQMNAKSTAILVEPKPRNTAPAVCAAAEYLMGKDEDALMLVVPSDHKVEDELALMRAVSAGIESAQEGHIVTFGIRPDRAETGYGYIELSRVQGENEVAQRLLQFIEKPSAQGAAQMIETGRYVWNAGIFLIAVRTARRLFEQHTPKMRSHIRMAVMDLQHDIGFSRLGANYGQASSVSFDKAIMERETGYVVPVNPGWSDIGSWQSVWQESDKDEHGVSVSRNAQAIDCEDCLLRSEDDGVAIVGIGLKNITAVATRDAVLISDLDAAQSVSVAVEKMRENGVPQADMFPRHDRPWGHYETLSLGNRFQVKSIVVKPGGKLSLQSHVHRAEHWVVVEGTATVTIGSDRKLIGENMSIYIPQGEIHRLENEGKLPLQLIEVQTGCYLGEDDIVRYEDIYARA